MLKDKKPEESVMMTAKEMGAMHRILNRTLGERRRKGKGLKFVKFGCNKVVSLKSEFRNG